MVDLLIREKVFASLGDARRLTLLELLAARDHTVSELAAALPISLQGTLKHLAVLEDSGLVSRAKSGRVVTVHLERQTLAEAERWMHRTRTFWTGQLASLSRSFPAPSSPAEESS